MIITTLQCTINHKHSCNLFPSVTDDEHGGV